MRIVKFRLLILCIFAIYLAAGVVEGSPYFSLLSKSDWQEAMSMHIRPMTSDEWADYQYQFNDPCNLQGPPYPSHEFRPATLYVYGGPGTDYNDAGLVMGWGDPCNMTEGQNYASAWIYEYGLDPDLSNATVTVQVEPPCGINTISLGLQDNNGRIRSWTWNVAAAGVVPPLPLGTLQCSPDAAGNKIRTTITINLAQTGVAAANPQAAAYSNWNPPPAFNIRNVLFFIFDENAVWRAGIWAPPPGQGNPKPWNYWFNLVVTSNPPGGAGAGTGKHFLKWSQPPMIADPCEYPLRFIGWDEKSIYNVPPMVADDWMCEDDRPVTDIHWWGSFLGWKSQVPPAVKPKAFRIGIWTDFPDPDPCNPNVFSHPDKLIWENYCTCAVWNFAGYDEDPRGLEPNESCFQFTQLLSQDEWFFQEPNDPYDDDPCSTVYWLSIAAIYDPCDVVEYPWGWKTREHYFNDDAVRIMSVDRPWPPTIGSKWTAGNPIYWPDPNHSWDVAFELTTCAPAYTDNPMHGDLNADKIVNFLDMAILASNWLEVAP